MTPELRQVDDLVAHRAVAVLPLDAQLLHQGRHSGILLLLVGQAHD